MAVLVFADGPVAGQRVENSDPTDVRWYCEMKAEGMKPAWWWVFHGEPPEDDNVKVTKYRVVSIKPDRGATEGDPSPTIHTYAVEEE